MRKLNVEDAFKTAKLIKKAGLKEKLAEFVREGKNQKDAESYGITVFMELIEACGEDGVDGIIYSILDDVTGQEVRKMELKDFWGALKEIAQENDLESFFKAAGVLK